MISRRPLPDRSLALSELSLGCAQLGNMYRELSDADARDTVDAAWELGVRYFDTAPHYGLGLSEQRLGAAGTTLPAAALAFPLAHRAVASVCVGAHTAGQMRRNADLYREAIAPDLWDELKAEGLIREDAPVPGWMP